MVQCPHGLVSLWSSIPVVQWPHGPVSLWSSIPVVQCPHGPVSPLSSIPVVQCSCDPVFFVVHCSCGLLFLWSSNLVAQFSFGPLFLWSSGLISVICTNCYDFLEDKTFIGQSSTKSSPRTLEGYLFKQGALLKGWKARWFVLDFMKHQVLYWETLSEFMSAWGSLTNNCYWCLPQLRYHDYKDDHHCRGFIDLAEVISVMPTKPVPGAPKRADDNAFFEVQSVF